MQRKDGERFDIAGFEENGEGWRVEEKGEFFEGVWEGGRGEEWLRTGIVNKIGVDFLIFQFIV